MFRKLVIFINLSNLYNSSFTYILCFLYAIHVSTYSYNSPMCLY